jgi:endo-alpha-1,4-polygalactosaminidase (GH114 family)
MMCHLLLIAFPLVFGPANLAPAPEPARFQPTSFQLYYGGDATILARLTERLRAGQVVVLETRALTKPAMSGLLKEANRKGAKVLGYLSIGELHENDEAAFRRFLRAYIAKHEKEPVRSLEALTIQLDPKFNARHVDVRAEPWRAYVRAEGERLQATGVHGLFLDTVDTVDLYIGKKDWSLARRCESVTAMITLVRPLKGRDRGQYVLQNRGLNLIGPTVFVGDATGKEIPGLGLAQGHPDNPDAVLWENAFAGIDAWSRRKEKELREIQKSGRAAVFALGYKETLDSSADFFAKSAAAGFVPAWATSSERLHQELTIGPGAKRVQPGSR